MPPLERIAAVCDDVERNLRDGEDLRYRAIDAATALLLGVGVLERDLTQHQAPEHVVERVRADLSAARSRLHEVETVAQTAAELRLRDLVLDARTLVLSASQMLIAVAR